MQRKLIIVEDDDDLYEGMEFFLRTELKKHAELSVDIIRAKTYAEARGALKQSVPDVISIDMRFPSIEGSPPESDMGAELARYIKSHHAIPVILYSSNEVEYVRKLLEVCGVKDLEGIEVLKKQAGGAALWVQAVIKHLA